MVTKQDCVNAGYRDTFRYLEGTYSRNKELKQVRVSGKCQTWKTRPDDFRLPIKYGLYESSAITPQNAALFITEKEYQDRKEQAQAVGQVLKKNPSDIRIVHNKLLGGWYVVRGPHQTPLNGRFDSKEAVQAWLNRRKKNPVKKFKRAVLVYQAGIANVFAVSSFNLSDYGRNAIRLYQGDFRGAETYANGLAAAGIIVRTAGVNLAGDIANAEWTDDLESLPFSDKFHPVKKNPAKKYKRQLSVPEKHQLKVAYDTLKMSDIAAHHRMLGGSNKPEAREIIKRLTGKTMKENPAADKVPAHELYLFAINDANLYRQRIEPVIKNLRKKIKRKVYDHNLALKLWKYVADDAAKRYTHGGYGVGKGYGVFDVATRLETAKALQIYYDEQFEEQFINPKSRSRKPARAFDARSIRHIPKATLTAKKIATYKKGKFGSITSKLPNFRVQIKLNNKWKRIGDFNDENSAREYATALYKKHNKSKQVRVIDFYYSQIR